MEQRADWRSRTRSILLWVVTILLALGLGLAGLAKFVAPSAWEPRFVEWGYPAWFSMVVGAGEVAGAVGLLVPRLAFYAALLLCVIMMGALVTLLTHRGGPFGWGATPAVYIILLSVVAAARWKQRAASV